MRCLAGLPRKYTPADESLACCSFERKIRLEDENDNETGYQVRGKLKMYDITKTYDNAL
jgi:hypothetical protein